MTVARRPFDPAASYVWRCAVTYAAVQVNAGDPVDPDVVPWGKRRDLFKARKIILAPVVESPMEAVAKKMKESNIVFTGYEVEEWEVVKTKPKTKRKLRKKKAKSLKSQLSNLPPREG